MVEGFVFSLCPSECFMSGEQRVLDPWGRAGMPSSFKAAEGISPGRHLLCFSFGNWSSSAGRNLSVSQLRVRKLSWGKTPTHPFVCSHGEPKLCAISSLVWTQSSEWEVILKMPFGACSQFLLVSDILSYLPADGFILFPSSSEALFAFQGMLWRGTLGRASCSCPSCTGGFGARLAFLGSSIHDSSWTSSLWLQEDLQIVSQVFYLCHCLLFHWFLRQTKVSGSYLINSVVYMCVYIYIWGFFCLRNNRTIGLEPQCFY